MSRKAENGIAVNTRNNRRRRKKRRTEDFSSDSDSSSSLSMDEDKDEDQGNENDDNGVKDAENNINIDDIDVDSDGNAELHDKQHWRQYGNEMETLTNDKIRALANVKVTDVAEVHEGGEHEASDANQVKERIYRERAQLNNEYLKLMASEFSDDLDELRKQPDFTDKSLVTLAKALQSGGNMFDERTLEAIIGD